MPDPLWPVGVSMTPFGRFPDQDLLDLAADAALGALTDAGLTIADVGVLAAGTVFHANESVGQQLLKQVGQTGIPVYNVANACATGATALRTACMALWSGNTDVALAVGVEQMGKLGLLATELPREGPEGVFRPEGRLGAVRSTEGVTGTETMPGVFAMAGLEYAGVHGGVGLEQFARIADKNHAHSTLNPLAQYRERFTLGEILAAPMISYPNTSLMCSPTADGAAAAVVVTAERLRALPSHRRDRAVKISASVITTDPWTERGHALPDFNTLTRNAAVAAYETAGSPRRTSISSSCTTASRPPSFSTTTISGCANPVRPAASSTKALRGATGPPRSTCPGVSSPKGIRSARQASRASMRSPPTFAVRPGTARSKAPPSASRTSSASATPAASTSSNGAPGPVHRASTTPQNHHPRLVSAALDRCGRGFAPPNVRTPR